MTDLLIATARAQYENAELDAYWAKRSYSTTVYGYKCCHNW